MPSPTAGIPAEPGARWNTAGQPPCTGTNKEAGAYPPDKAHRPEDPPELPPQFDLREEALAALGQERAHSKGWEADDAIAALARSAAPGDLIEIVTGDRDLLQLVRDDGPTVRLTKTSRVAGERG